MAIMEVLPVYESDHLHRLIDYAQKDEKTNNKELVFLSGCQQGTAYNDFENIKIHYGKTDGILAHQFIQSFPKGEVTVEQAHEISKEFAEKMLTGYQYIIGTHIDTDHIHTHIVINSVNSITGKKYYGNLNSLALMRKANDEICRNHGLSIIENPSGLKRLDKTTYEMGKQGKSWKVKLTQDLDSVLDTAKTKDEFLKRLEDKGYKVEWKNKNIVYQAPNETKKIRTDTLAKQFGGKYQMSYISNLLGVPVERPLVLDNNFLRNVEADEKYSEWNKIENLYFSRQSNKYKHNNFYKMPTFKTPSFTTDNSFSQYFLTLLYMKRGFNFNKPKFKTVNKITSIKKYNNYYGKTFGNVNYKRLISVYGNNVTIKIKPEQIPLLSDLGIFYSGYIKDNGNVLITFKEINKDIIKNVLNIDVDSIKSKDEITEEKFRNKWIKSESQRLNKELCRYILTADDLRALEKENILFSYYRKGTEYTTLFFKDDLKKICDIINKDYNTEKIKFDNIHNQKNYMELKKSAVLNNTKVIYRIVDENGLIALQNSSLKFSYFDKEDIEKNEKKYNIAFLENDIIVYKEILQKQSAKKRVR